MATDNKIVFIGNAHLDIVWLWEFEEGCQEVRATFRSAIDRIKEHPSFVFSCASAFHYEFVRDTDPKLFEEIRKAVAEGRWYICGGWYIQPDCNAPSGESFARHGLYSQNFFFKEFGKMSTTGYNVDSFGHNANIPQFLQGEGMENYVFMRPSPAEQEIFGKHLFKWKSSDGSEVIAFRIPYSYELHDETAIETRLEQDLAIAEEENVPIMLFYGVGDHGGGPTKAQLKKVDELIAAAGKGPYAYGTPDTYFSQVRNSGVSLPEYTGELQHHAIGCYSLMAEVKRMNSTAEALLGQLEKLNVIFRDKLSLGYDTSWYEKQWKKVLLNQFHDIMGGCCIQSAYDRVFSRFGSVIDSVRDEINLATQRLGSRLNTSDGDLRLLAVNTNSYPVEDVVEFNALADAVLDENGKEIPMQLSKGAENGTLCSYRTRLKINIPAFGYSVLRLKNHRNRITPAEYMKFSREYVYEETIGTGRYKLDFDRTNRRIGCVSFDGKPVLSAIRFNVVDDYSDAWSHAQNRYSGLVGELKLSNIVNVSTGSVYTEYECLYEYGESNIVASIILYNDIERVDIKIRAFAAMHHKLLRIVFELPEASEKFESAIPYAHISRLSDGKEWPCQRWIMKKGSADRYVAVANDSVYSCTSTERTMEYTLLRTPIGAHHFPVVPSGNRNYIYSDQGVHFWNLSIVSGSAADIIDMAISAAQRFSDPIIAMVESIHDGDLEPVRSSESLITEKGISVGAIKQAEDGSGLIMRLVENAGIPHDFTFDFMGKTISTKISPYQIKTIKITEDEVRDVNLIEK